MYMYITIINKDHAYIYIWVNYNDLTVLPNPGNHGLFIGNHPQMAAKNQVSEIL